MKKIILLIFLFLFPCIVHATVNYDVDAIYMDAKIEKNGNLHMKEMIVLTGSFHGYVREITYRNSILKHDEKINFSQDAIYNGTGITDMVIKAKKLKTIPKFERINDEDYETLTKISYMEDATNKNYVESSIQDGKSYRMYYEGEDETVAFLLEYTIQNVVVKHQDVAELYWQFLGSSFDDRINDVMIRVTLPEEDLTDSFRVWAHGDLTGEVHKTSEKTVEASIKKLQANHPVDIRLTFEKNIISEVDPSKQTNEVALPQILEVEESRAQEAETNRYRAQLIRKILIVICTIYVIVVILWWIYVYLRFDKEYKSDFQNEYNREFIDRYNVEVVDVLMTNQVSSNALTASILNLIYKKNISLEEIDSTKKEKNYEFTLENQEGLNDTEEVLIHFLFERVGKNNKFTTKDLKKYASSVSTYQSFQNSYSNWVECVKKDAKRQNFYEQNGLPVITSLFLLLISIFICFAVIYFGQEMILGLLPLFIGIIFFIYCAFIKKRSKQGNEDYVRWKAFKKFLLDFGNFEIKELPEIALWERYLVYAAVFGIADQVEKSMNVKIKEFTITSMDYYPSWIDLHIANSIHSQIMDSLTLNRSTYTREIASSQSSSGAGFGGGFSSGGGFGGGGGGGHGF